MRFLAVAALLVLLLYGCVTLFDSPPDFDEKLAELQIVQIVFSPQGSRIVLRNTTNRTLDRINIMYSIIPTTNSARSRDITFETPRSTVLEPGDTITLTSRGVSATGIAQQPHFRLRRIRYREVPF
jgi:hypothetical protein